MTIVEWISATAGWGYVSINKSVEGNKLIVSAKIYQNGIHTHVNSIGGLNDDILNRLEGSTIKFNAFTQYPTGSIPKNSVKITFQFNQLGISDSCVVRDLWPDKNIGESNDYLSLYVKNHGAKLLKINEVKQRN